MFSGPDGHTVDPHAPPLHGTTAELIDAHDQHGLDIAVDHVGGRWHGDHMDWDCFFAGIASLNRPPGVPEVAAGGLDLSPFTRHGPPSVVDQDPSARTTPSAVGHGRSP